MIVQMPAMRTESFSGHPAHVGALGVSAQVVDRDDSHQVHFRVHHRQSAKPPCVHQVGGFVDVLIFPTPNYLTRHYLPHRASSWVTPLSSGTHDEIAWGNQTNERRAVANRQDWDILGAHLPGRFPQGSVGSDRCDSTIHYMAKLHCHKLRFWERCRNRVTGRFLCGTESQPP